MDYLVVDLETGEKRHTDAAPDLSRGICRTKELRLRRIPKGTFAMGTLVEIREENGEGSAWLARVCAPRAAIPPCGTLGRRPREARENLSSVFFRKISPAGLAIPFSRLRVSPAPEMAHLCRPPLVGSRPAPWKPDSAMLCADRPALVARGDPNFEYVEPESTGLSFLSWRV